MSKYYIHKNKNGIIKTSKETLIANIDKLDGDYEYKKGLLKKTPTELIIRGKQRDDFTYYTNLIKIPIKKVIIDCNIHSHNQRLKGFFNTKELEITKNANKIEIYNNYGLINIKNLTIPFNISIFDNNYILNNEIKTITIKHEDKEEIIELDDVFLNKRIDISISNTHDILNIYLDSKYNKVNYKVYIENNEIKYDKKYIKYEILPDEDKVLDLLELRRIYNCEFIANKVLNNEIIILSKEDYLFLTNAFINSDKLKEIIIKDDNEMSLFPRIINIKLENNKFKIAEMYDNKLMLSLEKKDKVDKIILINEDLTNVKLEREYLNEIRKIYLDFNTTKFNLIKEDERYVLTIPMNINNDTKNLKILTYLIRCASEVYVKTKEKTIKIPKYNYLRSVTSVKRYNEKDFSIEYDVYGYGIREYGEDYIIYLYDESKKDYNIGYSNSERLVTDLVHKNIKKLIKKL